MLDIEDLGNNLVEIIGTQPVLEGEDVKASPKDDGTKKLNVIYSYIMAYDKNGTAVSHMDSHIGVTTDGKIFMKQHLNPGVNVTSIEGYKVVVRLQASENGYFYGKPAFVCIELLKK